MMGLNSTSLKLISRSVHGFYPVVCVCGGGLCLCANEIAVGMCVYMHALISLWCLLFPIAVVVYLALTRLPRSSRSHSMWCTD